MQFIRIFLNRCFNRLGINQRGGQHCCFESENIFRLNGVKFILSCDIKEMQNIKSSENCFLLGKTPLMVEKMIDLGKQREIMKIFEMGIFQGGSTVLYDQVFQADKIVAIDYHPQPVEALGKYIEQHRRIESIKPYYGVNQADRSAMESILTSEFPKKDIDLIVDDASHFYLETRAAFNINFPFLKAGGLYIIEDWAWAHWAGDLWQKDASPFGESKAMSNFLIELFMFTASCPEMVEDIVFNHNTIILKKGSGSFAAEPFDIGDHYLLRGKTFQAWL